MKKKLNVLLVIVLAIGLMFAMAGCGEESSKLITVKDGDVVGDGAVAMSVKIVDEEEISTDTGRVDFDALKKPVVRFLAVRDVYGEHLKYDLFVGYLKTKPGTLKLQYTYTPSSEKTLDGTAEIALEVSKRMMAYGVAAEYCFIVGLYEEGEAWAKKYRDSIMAVYRAQKGKKIKARRWV